MAKETKPTPPDVPSKTISMSWRRITGWWTGDITIGTAVHHPQDSRHEEKWLYNAFRVLIRHFLK